MPSWGRLTLPTRQQLVDTILMGSLCQIIPTTETPSNISHILYATQKTIRIKNRLVFKINHYTILTYILKMSKNDENGKRPLLWCVNLFYITNYSWMMCSCSDSASASALKVSTSMAFSVSSRISLSVQNIYAKL